MIQLPCRAMVSNTYFLSKLDETPRDLQSKHMVMAQQELQKLHHNLQQ
jgi:hypothetical protein